MRGRLYRRLRRLVGPGGRVVNSYGLSEATIDSTYFDAARDESKATVRSRSAARLLERGRMSWTGVLSRLPVEWSANCT